MIRELPEDYKKTVLIGYFSIILFVISLSIELILDAMYGNINGQWGGHLTLSIFLLAFILFFYFFIKISKIKDKTVQTNFIIIITAAIAIVLLHKWLIP
jgi:hypothetical protein